VDYFAGGSSGDDTEREEKGAGDTAAVRAKAARDQESRTMDHISSRAICLGTSQSLRHGCTVKNQPMNSGFLVRWLKGRKGWTWMTFLMENWARWKEMMRNWTVVMSSIMGVQKRNGMRIMLYRL